jgi:hypothetical protein
MADDDAGSALAPGGPTEPGATTPAAHGTVAGKPASGPGGGVPARVQGAAALQGDTRAIVQAHFLTTFATAQVVPVRGDG